MRRLSLVSLSARLLLFRDHKKNIVQWLLNHQDLRNEIFCAFCSQKINISSYYQHVSSEHYEDVTVKCLICRAENGTNCHVQQCITDRVHKDSRVLRNLCIFKNSDNIQEEIL